jgi:hypothetical protein
MGNRPDAHVFFAVAERLAPGHIPLIDDGRSLLREFERM